MTNPKPIAILISDIHYSINTLELADAALRQAIAMANDLDVVCIVAGDLHDTKANMRGECVNAMLKTFATAKYKPFVLVGNHDKINEKSEAHALNFLRHDAILVNQPFRYEPIDGKSMCLIPYQHDLAALRDIISQLDSNDLVIMHQGIEGSDSGDYIQDKTALTHDEVKDLRIISGHYHQRQDIKTGRPRKGAIGMFSYIGNPYTLNFAEANDPEKGFQILMDNNLLEFVPTNLRKHLVIDTTPEELELTTPVSYNEGDLIKVKVSGTREALTKVNKTVVRQSLGIVHDFRLDTIITDRAIERSETPQVETSNSDLLDTLVEATASTEDRKARLKALWRTLCE